MYGVCRVTPEFFSDKNLSCSAGRTNLTMTRISLGALFLFATIIVFPGCDSINEAIDSSGMVDLVGYVVDETDQPVAGAFVRAHPGNTLTESDADGRYQLAVEIDSTINVTVTASKEGYGQVSRQVLAVAGRTVEVPNHRLQRATDAGPVSGRASNILLLSQSSQSIGVRESGSEEVAQIVFQIADSLGRPVTLANAIDVNFSFGANPAGGAFIHPETARTDNQGRVTVNLSSGTAAGVVQIAAETNVEGRTLRSLPVSVAIHGGLPNARHFTIGPERFNFPGRRANGLTNPISVIVGDKHGNPVKQGTAVYFTTSHGVVEGSALTNAQGRGSVNLISANPLPPNGVAIVTATTADENRETVTGTTPVLFSGPTVLTVSPGYADINETYTVTLTDDLGNPLAQGTSLNVRVEGTRVKAVGSTSASLGDTVFDADFNPQTGEGVTEFTFRAVSDLNREEDGEPVVEAITIGTSGPNGQLEIVLTPRGAAVSKNGTLYFLTDGVQARVTD